MLRVYTARTAEELEHARILLLEEAAGPDVGELPGPYAPPRGRLLVAEWQGRLAGCVTIAPLDGPVCAMSRLYVRAAERQHGIGRRLAASAFHEACVIGYRAVRCSSGAFVALSTRDR